MNYEQIEDEIVSRLISDVGIATLSEVIVLPDSVAAYKTPVAKGLITVVFVGEKFDKNQAIGEPSQHSSATFNLSVQARKLRGSDGVYAIAEKVKQSIIGFQVSDCGPFTLVEHDFSSYQNDIWEHSISISCRTLRTSERTLLANDEVVNEEVYYQNLTTNENIQVQR